MSLTCSSGLSSGGGACCLAVQAALPGWPFTTPCQGVGFNVRRLSVWLCSLADFHASLEGQRKYGCAENSGLGQQDHGHLSSMKLPGQNISTWKKTCQPRMLYLEKLSFRNKGEIKTFPNKEKLNEFLTTRPAVREELTPILLKLFQKYQHKRNTHKHILRGQYHHDTKTK